MCQRYSALPSSVAGIEDDAVAADFDVAIAMRGSEEEKEVRDRVQAHRDNSISAESLYALTAGFDEGKN